MLPKYHIVIGAIVSLIIYLVFQTTILQTLIIFLASFLIDVDHYLLYLVIKKDFSLKKAVNYFKEKRKKWLNLKREQRERYKRAIFVFHGIEFWFFLLVIASFINLVWFVLIGILIHMILDYIDLIYINDPLYTKFSQLYVYYTNKRKKEFM